MIEIPQEVRDDVRDIKANAEDDSELLRLCEKAFNPLENPGRQTLERVWFRNILYYIGEQYIQWFAPTNSFRRKASGRPTPTPTDNLIRDHVKTMKSMILNREYKPKVWPNSDEVSDREAAEIAGKFLEDLDRKGDGEFDDEKEKLAISVVLLGIGWMRVFPDMDAGRWSFTQDGSLLPEGDIAREFVLPFNVFVDPIGDKLKKKRWIGVKSLKSVKWIKEAFGVEVHAETGDGPTIDYQRRLMSMVANVSPWKGVGINYGESEVDDEDVAVFKELEIAPTKEYPLGRYAVFAGGKLLKKYDRMPIPNQNGIWHYSLTDFHYNYVPGRFYSDPTVNDLISHQDTINSIDKDSEMNRKGVGRPIVLTPNDLEVERVNKYGQSFIALKYDARASGGMRPEIHSGTPLPEQFLKQRDIHRVAFQDAAGNPKNVLAGSMPSATASGVMVDMLQNAAEQSHGPDIHRFYRGLNKVYRKTLILAQEVCTEERMIKISGAGKNVSVKKFLGSDISDNTDVNIEVSNWLSSTHAGRAQILTDMAKEGLLGDVTTDPEVRSEFHRQIGVVGFKDKTNADIVRAQEENSLMALEQFEGVMVYDFDEATGMPIPVTEDPLFEFDDHAIHFEIVRRFILSKEFKVLPEQAQIVILAHAQAHKVKLMEAMQRQAMQAMQGQQGANVPEM